MSFFKLLFIIITCAHWIACLFHLIRKNNIDSKISPVKRFININKINYINIK